MTGNHLETVLSLLKRLQGARIYYTLAHNQEDAITIQVVVPGQRWEIDCYVDGAIEVEIFKSDGTMQDATIIDRLFHDFSG